jgi:hypothetical protein
MKWLAIPMINAVAAFLGLFGAGAGWLAARLMFLPRTVAWDAFGIPIPADSLVATFAAIGAAAGMILTIAAVLALRCRSAGEVARRTLALTVLLMAFAAIAYSLRASVLEHMGMGEATPVVEFEIRLPRTLADHVPPQETQVEFRSAANQRLAQLQKDWRPDAPEKVIVSGQVAIDVGTAERFVVLNMPGEPSRLFRLRIAQHPSRSGEFSPWHHVDTIVRTGSGAPQGRETADDFAIRYRVM